MELFYHVKSFSVCLVWFYFILPLWLSLHAVACPWRNKFLLGGGVEQDMGTGCQEGDGITIPGIVDVGCGLVMNMVGFDDFGGLFYP